MADLTVHRHQSFRAVVDYLTSGHVRHAEGPIRVDPRLTGNAIRHLYVTLDDGSRHRVEWTAGSEHKRDEYMEKVLHRLLAGSAYTKAGRLKTVHRITWSREL